MDLDRLRFFVQVAELGSFGKAASMTGVDQSGISRKINALEQDCSGRLFHRTGRGVTLTEFGQLILPRVKALLNDADQLADAMKTCAGVPSGLVRIGIMPSLSDPSMSILLSRVRARFPAIHLCVFEGSGGQIDEWLVSGRVDFAVLFRYGTTAPAGEEGLALVNTCLVGKSGNTLTTSPQIEFSKLDGVPLILPSVPNGLRVALGRIAQQEHIDLSVVMEADSLSIQKNIAMTGDAFAVLGSHAVRADVEAGTLQASCIVNPRIMRTIVLSTTSAHPSTLASREVATLTRRIFERLVSDGSLGVEVMLPRALESQKADAASLP
jgi:DNA-binding transcriptional LysR family regulator